MSLPVVCCGFCLVHCITKEYAKTNLILIKLKCVPCFDFGNKCNTFVLMQFIQKTCWLVYSLYSAFWLNSSYKKKNVSIKKTLFTNMNQLRDVVF